MSIIPLEFQRRQDERWAARFSQPNLPTTPKHQFERQAQELDTPGAKTITHKPAGVRSPPAG
jgi:hypothetical protein